jgi:glycosyltransferase involved in cell wall biosynthesis
MLVSIIIPTFNRDWIIVETINSVLKQNYSNWELIIVDDGSTDDTISILNKYANIDQRISYFKRPDHLVKGANSCRNFGLEKAEGDLIKWLDSDDLLVSDCLISQVEVFKNNTNTLLCLGYSQFFNHFDSTLNDYWSRNNTSNNYLSDHIVNKIRWNVGGLMWRKSILGNSPFNIYLKNSQEWLMHSEFLLVLKNLNIYNFKKTVCLVRRGNSRMSDSKSSEYYFHQCKARIILLKNINKLSFIDIYELIKQVILYSVYSIISIKIKF